MSSMFKKKGGPAFKPKIPSARSSRPAPTAPSRPSPSPNASASRRPSTHDANKTQSTLLSECSLEEEDTNRDSQSNTLLEPPPTAEDTDSTPVPRIDSVPPQTTQPSTDLSEPTESLSKPTEPIQSPSRDKIDDAAGSHRDGSDKDAGREVLEAPDPVQITTTSSNDTRPRRPSRHPTISGPEPVTPVTPAYSTYAPPAPPALNIEEANLAQLVSAVEAAEEAQEDALPQITDIVTPRQPPEELQQTRSRKRRAENATNGEVKPRKRRARSVTPEDAESRVVDLQELKMSDLTRDLHIGKKFSRHDELRERERQARIKARLRKLSKTEEETEPAESETSQTKTDKEPASAQPTPAAESAPQSGPQFRIVDGQIIIDQSSLVMDRHARAAAANAGQDMETIEENDFTKLVTSNSFMNTSKLRGPNNWGPEETQLFYRGLSMFGTDFEMISKMFPGKQRRHIKLKFNREERHNAKLIDAALIGEKTTKMDLDEYTSMTGSTFEPVEKIEAEQRKIEEDYEAERKRIADEQAEVMRKKREELFADDEDGGGGGDHNNKTNSGDHANAMAEDEFADGEPKTKGTRKGRKSKKPTISYGLNGEPVTTGA